MNSFYYKTNKISDLLRIKAKDEEEARWIIMERIDRDDVLIELYKEKKGGGLIDLMHS